MSGTKTTQSAAKVSTGRKSKASTPARAPKKTVQPKMAVDPAAEYARTVGVRTTFITLALNMGWRMAIAIILPTAIGWSLDRRFHSAPSYALAGLFIGVFLAILIIVDTVRGLNSPQTKEKHRV